MNENQKHLPPAQDTGWKDTAERNLSGAALKSERTKKIIGLILGPLAFLIIGFLFQPTEGLSRVALEAIGVTVWTIVWWVCEPIPIPAASFVPFIVIPVLGILPVDTVWSFLGKSNTFLMLGVFIFTGVLIDQGVARRIALWLLSRKIASKSAMHLMIVFMIACAILSAFMSNIPCAVLFLMIGSGLIESLGLDPNHKYSQALTMSAAYGSQVGGTATPIGATNIIFLSMGLIASLTGQTVRFADWCAVGIPFAIIFLIITIIYFRVIFRFKIENMEGARNYAKAEYEKLGPMGKGEKVGTFLVLFAIVLWLVPSIVTAIIGKGAPAAAVIDRVFDAAVVSMFVGIICFFIVLDKSKKTKATTWGRAIANCNWGVIILVAAGLLIGAILNNPNIGVLAWLSGSIAGALSGANPVVIILCFVIASEIITQFISNVPATTVMVTVSVPVALATGMNPVALAITVTMACMMSFALPVAAPQMAIIYGAGRLSMGKFIRVGIIEAIIAIPVVTFFVFYWANLILPYVATPPVVGG